jgi:hypothetical protein
MQRFVNYLSCSHSLDIIIIIIIINSNIAVPSTTWSWVLRRWKSLGSFMEHARQRTLTWASWIQSSDSHRISVISIYVLSSHLHLDLQVVSFLHVFRLKLSMQFLCVLYRILLHFTNLKTAVLIPRCASIIVPNCNMLVLYFSAWGQFL